VTKSRPPQATGHVTRKHLARAEREALLQRWVIIATVAIVVLIVGVLGWAWFQQAVLVPRKVVAKVGNTEITVAQLDKAVRYQRLQMIDQLSQLNQYVQLAQAFGADASTIQQYSDQASTISSQLEQPDVVGRAALDSLINQEVVRQEAARKGITVSPEELDKEVQEAFSYYVNGTPTPAPTDTAAPTSTTGPTSTVGPTSTTDPKITPTASLTPTSAPTSTEVPTSTATSTAGPSPTATLTSTPRPTATPYTLEGFTKRRDDFVADLTKNTGMDEADFRRLVEYNILVRKLVATYPADKTIKTVHARHILVHIEDESKPESVTAAENIAKDIISQLQKGGDFVALAKQYSADTSNEDKGGDLGTQDDGYFVKEFNDVVFDPKNTGLIPTPVKTQFGFHVIEVLEHGTRTLSEAEVTQKQQTDFNTWLTAQRADTALVTEYDWQSYVPTHPTIDDVIAARPTETPEPTTPGPSETPVITETPGATAAP